MCLKQGIQQLYLRKIPTNLKPDGNWKKTKALVYSGVPSLFLASSSPKLHPFLVAMYIVAAK